MVNPASLNELRYKYTSKCLLTDFMTDKQTTINSLKMTYIPKIQGFFKKMFLKLFSCFSKAVS